LSTSSDPILKPKIDIALSSIGALARTWYKLIPENKYNVEFYNDTGLRKLIAIEREIEVEKKGPNSLKGLPSKDNIPSVDWGLDQTLISIWIEEYAEEFGWDTISPNKQNYAALRVDRQHINDGTWDDNLDLQIYSEPWKDSHFCQESYTLICFWRIHYLLKPFLAKKAFVGLGELPG
jgi:hypothetical protein